MCDFKNQDENMKKGENKILRAYENCHVHKYK